MAAYFHVKPTILPPAGFKPIEATERIILRVTAPTRRTVVSMDVGVMDACLFFAGKSDRLEGKKPDGSGALLIRVGDQLRPARDPNGELVLVAMSPRVVWRHRVLVRKTCDHMPGVSPYMIDPFGVAVVIASVPPHRVDMVVPEEQLDVKCTKNTY